MEITDILSQPKKDILFRVKEHAEKLLDHAPRFRYFTLHGKEHINSMFNITNILFTNGISLSEYEIYLLLLSICIHDLGMVLPLQSALIKDVFEGKNQLADPANIEVYIREHHNELVSDYISHNFGFLTSLGVQTSECGILIEISKSHRKTILATQRGYQRKLGALLRAIDELDIGPERAPVDFLRTYYKEMDPTSCWHWFKHNIVDQWNLGHNVHKIVEDGITTINFELVVRPPSENSIPYWLHQIQRPIHKVLIDESAASIIFECWHVKIRIETNQAASNTLYLGDEWDSIEQKALSHGRKVIIVVDDEVRKMEDLFIPLMDKFHIIFSPNCNDALTKIHATNIDLAIVDMQLGTGSLWSAEETDNFKTSGVRLCKEIASISPDTKIGILTGTRYDVKDIDSIKSVFFLRKPVDPEVFERKIYELFGLQCPEISSN